jgi:hypothetical protein
MRWRYIYKCWDCDITMELALPAKRPESSVPCRECGAYIEQDYTQKNVMPDIMETYVETNLTGQPIEMTSKRQRDQVMAEHGSTYDGSHWTKGPSRTPWEKDLTLDKVKAMAKGQRAEATYEADLD